MATRPALFRQEAIDFLHQRNSWGEVVSLQPVSSTILGWTLAGLIVVILCFLTIAQYARKETVSGYLTPTSGTARRRILGRRRVLRQQRFKLVRFRSRAVIVSKASGAHRL